MQISLVTDSTFSAVTIDEIKQHINYNGNDGNVTNSLIRMEMTARKLIEDRKGIVICQKTFDIEFEKEYDMNLKTNTLIMPLSPVSSVSAGYSYDQYYNETTLAENTDYYVRGLTRKEIYVANQENYILTGTNLEIVSWKFRIVAGYTETSIPDVYKEVLLHMVAEWHNNRGNYVPQLTSEVNMMLMNVGDRL